MQSNFTHIKCETNAFSLKFFFAQACCKYGSHEIANKNRRKFKLEHRKGVTTCSILTMDMISKTLKYRSIWATFLILFSEKP